MNETKPSKSARKREHVARQKLGEQLILIEERDLRAMGLDDDLLEAVLDAKHMSKRGAVRRQKQYIGKLMARVDPTPIQAALLRLQRR